MVLISLTLKKDISFSFLSTRFEFGGSSTLKASWKRKLYIRCIPRYPSGSRRPCEIFAYRLISHTDFHIVYSIEAISVYFGKENLKKNVQLSRTTIIKKVA